MLRLCWSAADKGLQEGPYKHICAMATSESAAVMPCLCVPRHRHARLVHNFFEEQRVRGAREI